MKFIPVDDHLKLKDSTNEIDIYHIVGNYHMADGVIVHVPASNLLVEADLTTQDWDFNWWGDSLMNNIDYRKIKVDTNLAVHAQKPFPLPEVVSAIERQVRNAQAFCRRAAEAQFFQPGCPIQSPPAVAAGLELSGRYLYETGRHRALTRASRGECASRRTRQRRRSSWLTTREFGGSGGSRFLASRHERSHSFPHPRPSLHRL